MTLPDALPVLRTERLVLRALGPADADAVYDIFSDAEVMRFWSHPPWTDASEAARFIAQDAEALAEGRWLRWGVTRRQADGAAPGAVIGTCGLFYLDRQNRRADVGYVLARAAWGHGYMAEAIAAVLAYGFETLGLNRVEADIDPRNAASIRAVERFGFVREGLLRERWIVDGEVCDTALYGLLRRDWARQREA